MHNNIMEAGSRDRPPMLAPGRYPQWHSRFLRYVDTRPNGEALRKYILSGPYKPTTILVHAIEATDNSLAVPEHTTTTQEMWEAIEKLQQGESLNILNVKTNLFWEFRKFTSHDGETMESYYTRFYKLMNEMIRNNLTVTMMQQYQNEVNELRAEKLARNANPLALVTTAQASQHPFYQSLRGRRSEQAQRDKEMEKNLALIAKYFKKLYKPTNNNLRTSSNSKNKNVDTTPRYKNDDHSGQFGIQRTMNVAGTREKVGSLVVQKTRIQCFNCKEYGHFTKECRKPKRVKDSTYHKVKMLLCKQVEQGVPLQAEQYDCLADMDEEVDEQELEAHYSYMAKIQENEQNDVESDDEHVALANLIANLKLDTEFKKYKAFNDRTVDYDKLERKPTPFSDSLERKYVPKIKLVPKTNVSESLLKPVTAQTLPQTIKKAVSNTNVLKPGMYRIDNEIAHTRAPQLSQTIRNTNLYVSTSTGVNHNTNVSRPQLKRNHSRDKVLPNNSQVKVKKTQLEVQPGIPSDSNKIKSVTACKGSLNSKTLNANAICATCNKCLVDSNHFACVMKMLNDVHARTKKPTVVPISTRKPKSQANKSIATTNKKMVASKPTNQKLQSYFRIVQLILFIVASGCTKHMMGNLKLLCNFVEKFLGTVRFGDDQFAPILSYRDLVQGNVTINRVYYVEGLNHDLFSVGQFCNVDLEVAFRKSTCFVRDLQANDLLAGNCGSNLYTISLQESTSSTPPCLMAKATPT
nr:hypothetical protein [Tanacetum cinerariifolium]